MSLLFLLPALDQDQQTYQPLSGMAWEEVWSCYHMCEWSTTSDSGRVQWAGVLSVTVGLVTSLQSSGRRYSVCILDTFKIGLILYTFFSYPSLTLWLNDMTTHFLLYNYHHTVCCW